MKKILVVIFAALVAFSANAQALKGLNIGGGLEVNPFIYTPSDIDELKVADGYNVFVSYPISIAESSAIAVGLRWSQTFNLYEVLGIKNDITRGYISLPVKFEQHFGGFFFNVGPTVSFWALFKDRVTVKEGNIKTTVNVFNEEGNEFSRVDVGVGAELGYDWRHIRLSAGYDYGLIKGMNKNVTDVNFNRQSVRVTVAYIF